MKNLHAFTWILCVLFVESIEFRNILQSSIQASPAYYNISTVAVLESWKIVSQCLVAKGPTKVHVLYFYITLTATLLKSSIINCCSFFKKSLKVFFQANSSFIIFICKMISIEHINISDDTNNTNTIYNYLDKYDNKCSSLLFLFLAEFIWVRRLKNQHYQAPVWRPEKGVGFQFLYLIFQAPDFQLLFIQISWIIRYIRPHVFAPLSCYWSF